MKGQKLLKVTSILMIIGGVIAAIVGVLAILGHQRLGGAGGERGGDRPALCKLRDHHRVLNHRVHSRNKGRGRLQRTPEGGPPVSSGA